MEAGLCWQCRGASGGQCVCEGDWVFIRTKCLSGVTAASRRRAVGEARRAFWIRRDVVTAKKGWGLGFEGEGREEGEGEDEDEERRPRDLCGQEVVVGEQKTVASPPSVLCGYRHKRRYLVLASRKVGSWRLAAGVISSTFFYNGACLVLVLVLSWSIASMLSCHFSTWRLQRTATTQSALLRVTALYRRSVQG